VSSFGSQRDRVDSIYTYAWGGLNSWNTCPLCLGRAVQVPILTIHEVKGAFHPKCGSMEEFKLGFVPALLSEV
jgi:hypothetical protein